MENKTEAKKEGGNILSRLQGSPGLVKDTLIILAILLISIGGYYFYSLSLQVSSDKAEIYAPLIILSPDQPGVLQSILVKNGDKVSVNQAVARLAQGDFIRAKTDGLVVSTNDQVGKLFSPGEPVVTMISPTDLRLIVHVAENKGLNQVNVGQKVVFTVDAFDSKKFNGTVEEIAQTSDQSSVVFSISDKRDEKNYSIKVKYDGYPELLNGMSAKASIIK